MTRFRRPLAALLALAAIATGFAIGAYWRSLVEPPTQVYVCQWDGWDPIEDAQIELCAYEWPPGQ